MEAYERSVTGALRSRLARAPVLLQIVTGPRQVGKTTAARQVLATWDGPTRYAAADLAIPPGPEWIETHWAAARREADDPRRPALLVLDEVQKVTGWSEVVKAHWDADRAVDRPMRVVLLGSSALLLARGATESLAGRFFLHRCPHWTFPECHSAFGWDLERWLFYGGYPGAAALVDDEHAWRAYITDALIETVVARDVLALQNVTKPTLLRHLFALAARFPAQIVSYTKMLGQLQDAGNTTTLAHYLRLLETAFLASGLERFSPGGARSRGSSPKIVLWNNALPTALSLLGLAATRADAGWWGRLVENAVGAHLCNHLSSPSYEVTYWRERNDEVDFIVRAGRALWAIEVKSGRPGKLAGLAAFRREHPKARALVVGTGGLPLEEFFRTPPETILEAH